MYVSNSFVTLKHVFIIATTTKIAQNCLMENSTPSIFYMMAFLSHVFPGGKNGQLQE